MTRVYASGTSVPAERSRGEVERLLRRYGADQFASGWADGQAVIAFRLQGLHIKLIIPMPKPDRNLSERQLEQKIRERWRAIVLIVKAKLEAVQAGIRTIEQEFLEDLVIPGGATFGQMARPQIKSAYETGRMPKSLPFLGDGT